jgi:hypothetical protein
MACGIALASCGGDDPTEPTTVSGSLAYSYTGAGATSATAYSASGSIPLNVTNNFGTNSWAAGSVNSTNSETDIAASVPRGNNTWDLTVITINRTTAGTAQINASCTAANCTEVAVIFGSSQTESSFTYFCELTTGSVTISSISSSNATGTFSGTGTCTSATGVTTNFTVTSGTFNVGLTSAVP